MVGCRPGHYGQNSENAFLVIIPLFFVRFAPNLVGMFFLMILMQCSIKNSKIFGHFMGVKTPCINGGGVLYRTFAGMIGHDEKKRFFDFFLSEEGENKKPHISERIFEKH